MADEKQLIDANALIKEANAEGAYGYVDVKQIADALTVDAILVVRGRNCKYHKDTHVTRFVHCRLYNLTMEHNDFCSYGKRKGGSDND